MYLFLAPYTKLPNQKKEYFPPFVFSDILERNNKWLLWPRDFWRRWVGEVGVVTFFVLEVPDYKSAMLIYLCIYLLI